VESSESHSTDNQPFEDSCIDNGLLSQIFQTSEELLHRANMRLESIDAATSKLIYCLITLHDIDYHSPGNDRGLNSTDILDANRDLISEYRDACDQFITASDDVSKIQHLINMHHQIDDPLHVLLLAMRKMGRGYSPIQ